MKPAKALKFLISLLFLAGVTHQVDLGRLGHTLVSLNPGVLILLVIGYGLGQMISALKWWLIATAGNVHCSYSSALKSYFLGMFVNCFGLGTVGGDVARGLLLCEGDSSRTAALSSVVADRAHGLAVLALLGASAAALFGHGSLDPKLVAFLTLLGLGISAGWVIGPWLLLRFTAKTNKLYRTAEQISEVFPKQPRLVLGITLLSLCFHLLQIGLNWVMGLALGVSLPWLYLLTAIPFINIFTSLPISWMGLGVREAAYIFFFAPAFLSEEQAVACGAMWLTAVTINSCIGGVIAFWTKDFSAFTTKLRLNGA